MKRIIILAALIFSLTAFNSEAKGFHSVGSYFYTELSPYGSWIEIDYGVVVWRPTIMQVNWTPYRIGRWVWTYDGWYWDSYESFGYITYHYGRWYYDDYYGWLWYPDYEWAPAWVEWRYSNDYIGWAPLHPYATFSISIGIHYSHSYYSPYHHWHFVGYRNFCDPYVYNYYVAPGYKQRVYSNTKYRTNYTYHNGRIQNRGVDVSYVRVRSGQDIRERNIVRVTNSRDLKSSDKNRNEIRSLDISREKLTRNNGNTLKVQKDRRKTSLDVSKVEVGKKNRNNSGNIKREKTDKNRNTPEVKNRNEKRTDNSNVRVNDSRNTKVKTDKDVKVKDQKRKSNDKDASFNKRKKSKTEINTNVNVNRQKQNTVEQNKNRTQVKTDQKKQVQTNRKTEVRTQKKQESERNKVDRKNKVNDNSNNQDSRKRNKR